MLTLGSQNDPIYQNLRTDVVPNESRTTLELNTKHAESHGAHYVGSSICQAWPCRGRS